MFSRVQAADAAPFANVCIVLLPLLSTSLVLVPHEIHRETLDTSILCCPITATGLLSQIGPAHKLFRNRPCHNCSRMSSTNCTTCCTANMSSSSLRIVLGQLTWRSQSSGYKCLKKNKKQKHGICDYLLATYIIKGCAATAEHRVALQTILHVFTQNN